MPVPDIRPVSFFSMPALESLDTLYGKAEPILFLLYRILRPQRYAPEADDGEKRRKQLCSYSHRQVRFIVIRQQAVPRRLT